MYVCICECYLQAQVVQDSQGFQEVQDILGSQEARQSPVGLNVQSHISKSELAITISSLFQINKNMNLLLEFCDQVDCVLYMSSLSTCVAR